MSRRISKRDNCLQRRRVGVLAGLLGAAAGCSGDLVTEPVGSTRTALSTTATRVLGFESVADWSATGATIAAGSRHVEGSASLRVSPTTTYVTIRSRTLSSLGNDVGSLIG